MLAMDAKTRVSIANTKACINPTNNSKPRNGIIPISGNKNAIAMRRTSPANILPNNLKVKLITLPNSLMSSRIPTKNPIGPD
jgi:hypothetical protein